MELPRIRREHAPYRTPTGAVRIGGGIPGLAAEIPDHTGWRWTLLTQLDGTRTTAQICAAVRAAHPDRTDEQILRLLADLAANGRLDDAAATPPAEFTAAELVRYGRAVELWSWTDPTDRPAWDVQLALRRAAVTVLGTGGAGSHAALLLAAAGVGRLHLVDHDTVEESNLGRQILFTADDIGHPKAQRAAARLRAQNPHVAITAQAEQVTSQTRIAELMADTDILVLCADEPAGLRQAANRASIATGRPWVDGGYTGPVISTALYRPGHHGGPCWQCLRTGEAGAHDLGVTDPADAIKALPKAIGHPVSAVTAALSGTYAAHAAISHLTGTTPLTPGTVHIHNLLTPGRTRTITHPRDPACPACAAPIPATASGGDQ
ncbi:HesA/MoeB/ThiF family protein [Kitasatospora sp. NPDC088783]|uniref:HesA/MoeB/ThiF family protein n=1 Tax=Kitasatospora sp. NPDC088783 TaxID=3364077 RepID=UPI00382DB4C5